MVICRIQRFVLATNRESIGISFFPRKFSSRTTKIH